MELKQIATIHTDFPEKFGIPRQSGLVGQLKGQIILEPAYRNREAFRGLAEYSHIWVLWEFSQAKREKWSPTVKPPRLGGNKRMGVFATRSPFRPNPIGLSALKLDSIEYHKTYGPVLHVSGVDMLDGTPIYDIKPYVPYADCRPEARGGFAQEHREDALAVEIAPEILENMPTEKREALIGILSKDPRPSYQEDSARIYGLDFAGKSVRFQVAGERLKVLEIQ